MTIAELRRRLASASPRPWSAWEGMAAEHLLRPFVIARHGIHDGTVLTRFGEGERGMASDDFALIAAAVNALPALLDVAEAASDVDRALKRHDDGDFSLEYEFELDNAWERLRAALAKLTVPNDTGK